MVAASDLINRCDLFSGLDPSVISLILEAGTEHHYAKREFLVLQGAPVMGVGVVLSGLAKWIDVAEDGEQLQYGWIKPCGVFGLATFAADNRVQPVSVQAVEESTTIEWSPSTIAALSRQHPALLRNALIIALNLLLAFGARLRQTVTQSVPCRVAEVLEQAKLHIGRATEAGIEVSISNEDLAQFADTSLFSVSRLLQQWSRQGLLTKSRGRICIFHGIQLLHHVRTAQSDGPITTTELSQVSEIENSLRPAHLP